MVSTSSSPPDPSETDADDSVSYDHIMLLEDPQPNTQHTTKLNILKFVFLLGCGLTALAGGFGLQVAMSGRRYRASLKTKPPQEGTVLHEDPVLFASRALGWGTLYAVLGTGSIGLIAIGVWKWLSPAKTEREHYSQTTSTNT